MTALSDDRQIQVQTGGRKRYPVAASTTIYSGAMLCDNGSGYAVPADDASGYVVIGVATERVDNSSGSAGDVYVEVESGAAYKMVTSGAGAGNVGDLAYVTDDQTVALTANDNGVVAGVVSGYVDSTHVWVYIPEAPILQDMTGLELVSPQISGGLNDVNGNELLKVSATAAAVNEVTLANAGTGNGPLVAATGDDASIPLTIAAKGSGEIQIGQAGGKVSIATTGTDKIGLFGGTPVAQQTDITQTYSDATTTVPTITAPSAGGGSGADATTFSGAECDAAVADITTNRKLINQIIDTLQAISLIG